MPIVFVHGVNTRRDENYQKAVDQRDAYLRQYALTGLVADPAEVSPFNPYWGEWAAHLAWHHASLPDGGQEAFGAADEDLATVLSDQAIALTADPERTLLKLAQRSLPEVVDLLLLPAMQAAADAQTPELLPLAHRLHQYASQHPQPAWLPTLPDDQAFLQRLQQEVTAWQPAEHRPTATAEVIEESFGEVGSAAWQPVAWGALQLQQVFSRFSGEVLATGRTPIHKTVSLFLGDIFKYVQLRGDIANPGPIVQTVLADLEAAVAAQSPQDPHLIIIAHSMGGNICYDILSHYRPTLPVDVFVTVGSQISLFEELKLFNLRLPNVPGTGGTHMPKPRNIRHWLNIYNTNDVLSFACQRVFADVVDYEFPAGSLFGMGAAHSLYFQLVSFYERLAVRLRRLLA